MMFREVPFLSGGLGSTLGEEGGGCVLPLTKSERSRTSPSQIRDVGQFTSSAFI